MISMDKRYRTRDGRKARVICVDAKGQSNPVFALIAEPNGSETLRAYDDDGRWYSGEAGSSLDLIEIPELEFDWSCLPKWAKWVTRDEVGFMDSWFWWDTRPALKSNGMWKFSANGDRGKIPSAYAPRYHGSDPAPIFQRPTEEGE